MECDSFADMEKGILAKVQNLGIKEIVNADSLLIILQNRLKKWQAQTKEKTEMQKKLADLNNTLQSHKTIIEVQGTTLSEKKQALNFLTEEYNTEYVERQKQFEDKIPDIEEAKFKESITNAEQSEKKIRNEYNEDLKKYNDTNIIITDLKKRLEEQIPDVQKFEVNFKDKLKSARFPDEKQFLEAQLPATDRDAMKLAIKNLNNKGVDIKARQDDREKRLSMEIEKDLTTKTLEEMQPWLIEFEENLKQLRDTLIGLKNRLKQNMDAQERIKDKQVAIEVQKKECQRWANLDSLIGSGDGKKYRTFAQGLTFELMISHANQQLEKMTDRYLLIRNEERPLELNVIDSYQAGEIRSTKNLSGGESFIVSLTLALGLSKMSSRKVRVDSLFLDEGFGTLDEDVLDVALTTLSGFQQDNKIIGIISHMSALKDRISTQITISPVSGGKSIIDGPGCSKIIHN